jgi:hypothetical protein
MPTNRERLMAADFMTGKTSRGPRGPECRAAWDLRLLRTALSL